MTKQEREERQYRKMAFNSAEFEAGRRAKLVMQKWPKFYNAHEAFATLLEEVDELKAHVWMKQGKRDLKAMRSECLDVALVALRMAAEVCNEERGRR